MEYLVNNKHNNTKSNMIFSNVQNDYPTLSFLITSYNRPNLIIETIDSIVNCVKGIDISYEIVVVDNHSQKNVIEELIGYVNNKAINNISIYLNEENIFEDNINRGIELSKGKYISIIHDDDLLGNNYLSEILKCLKLVGNDSKLGCIKVSSKSFVHGKGKPNLEDNQQKKLIEFTKNYSIINSKTPTIGPTCGILLNREAVFDVGGFLNNYGPSSDQSLGMLLLKKGYKCYKTINELSYCRVFDNDSSNPKTMIECNKNDVKLRKELYSMSIIGRLFGFVFEKTIYEKEIDFWIKHSKKVSKETLSVEQLDFLGDYKKRKIKRWVLDNFRRFYNKYIYLYAK